MPFDLSKINWKLLLSAVAAGGYIAWQNKGFKNPGKAITEHGVVALLVAVAAYFGTDFLLKVLNQNGVIELPPANQDQGPNDLPYLPGDDPNVSYRDQFAEAQARARALGIDVDIPPAPTAIRNQGLAGYSRQQHGAGLAGQDENELLGC